MVESDEEAFVAVVGTVGGMGVGRGVAVAVEVLVGVEVDTWED